ncbi:MAG TPA: glycoside hydrolase family 97 protein [Opitutaceae bacterium]|nr:glycoside hydrolase family 97 protein [Opitutaceae bacterium]HOR25561.1 glycoside hydrolase family 97 protein [Opitutaceae bacterium]HPK49879.1 glycoside hydrolase family 97 protein [Opitutaceae bacterium]
MTFLHARCARLASATGALLIACLATPSLSAAEESVASPDGRIVVTVSDTAGLRYRVDFDHQPAIVDSRLGLDFAGGFSLGRAAAIESATRADHDSTWENPFGQRRTVRDHYRELAVALREKSDAPSRLNLIVRAYDQGVALRYEIPVQPGLEEYTVTQEQTEFLFPADLTCWAGNFSECAENQYPEKRLTQLDANLGRPHVLPLLVKLPNGFAAIAESDLLDWAGMFVTAAGPDAQGAPRPGARVALAARKDGRGLVHGRDRRMSPWRTIQLAREAKELVASEFIATLATPSQLADTSWIKPGITAWDSWWTGTNPTQPDFKGLNSRGDTRSHKEYIDFAAEMGFSYQLIDWFWYEPMNNPKADLTKPAAHVDIPGLVAYARERNVRLLLWIDSHDLDRQGFDKVFTQVADWGFAGVKIDFMNSDSQETVRWYADVLAAAAKHKLLVDLHGAYKPTGLARTWPNYITQEGVLGNEYNKIPWLTDSCTPLHTITLPFTRGLLGPMDFTPGGFLNRTKAEFKVTEPAQVVGTRARQLAETVVYFSPLLCLCDHPDNYRGQPGVEFFRGLPTVWDETVVLSAEVAQHVVIARRAGTRWYLAAMNGDAPLTLTVPLSFLGAGDWKLRAFADTQASAVTPTELAETSSTVRAGTTLTLTLAPAGGYAATLTQASAP